MADASPSEPPTSIAFGDTRSSVLRRGMAVLALLGALAGCTNAPETEAEVRAVLESGELDRAVTAASDHLSRVEREHGSGAAETVRAMELLLEARRLRRDDLAERVELARRALDACAQLDEAGQCSSPRPWHELGLAAQEDPELIDVAEEAFVTLVDIQRRHPDNERGLQETLQVLGNFYLWRHGDTDRAIESFEESTEIALRVFSPDDPQRGRQLHNLGVAVARKSVRRALEIEERALEELRRAMGSDHADVAVILQQLGNYHLELGDYTSAEQAYRRGLEIREEQLGTAHPSYAALLVNLGLLAQRMGNLATARELGERAISLVEDMAGGEERIYAIALENLAGVHHRLGELDEARRLYLRAIELRRRLHAFEHPIAHHNLAMLALDLDELDEAERSMNEALAAWDELEGSDSQGRAHSLHGLALLHLMRGDHLAAVQPAERALDNRRKKLGATHPLVAASLELLAELRRRAGEPELALGLALEASEIGRSHTRATVGSLPHGAALRYAAFRRAGVDLAVELAASGSGTELVSRAWDAVVRSRALVLDEMTWRHRVIRGDDDPTTAELVDALAGSRRRLAELTVRSLDETTDADAGLLAEAMAEKVEAERRLALHSASFREMQAGADFGLSDLVALLPARTSVVAYVTYGDERARTVLRDGLVRSSGVTHYAAFVLRDAAAPPELVRLGDSESVEGLVRRWHAAVSRPPEGLLGTAQQLEEGYLEVGRELRRAIWDPVEARLEEPELVLVVPAGALHHVSLAILPTDGSGYLVERAPTVHYLSAERDARKTPSLSASQPRLLALGNPSFDVDPGTDDVSPAALQVARRTRSSTSAECAAWQRLRFDALPSSEVEAREVARLWQSYGGGTAPEVSQVRVGTGAGEAAFKRLASEFDAIHLATHAYFVREHCRAPADRPGVVGPSDAPLLLSGLVLAGANRRLDGSADLRAEDGLLSGEEVTSLDLSRARWVVLSGCETGVGDVQTGEGVLGLRRAFRMAGAGTLIMSLWRIEDEASRLWMRALYESRLSGATTAESMRAAAVSRLRQRRADGLSTHPYYWGPFVATGDWR